MQLSDKARAKIIAWLDDGGFVADPHSPENLIATTDTEEIAARHHKKQVYDRLKADFESHLLELHLLGLSSGGDITDMMVFDVSGKMVSHLGNIDTSQTDRVQSHARSLLVILKDNKYLVGVKKKIGVSLFDHGVDDEVITTLTKTLWIKIKAKTKHEANYKALCRLIEQERAMTVGEKGLSDYASKTDIKAMVLSDTCTDLHHEMMFDGACYTVTSTSIIND